MVTTVHNLRCETPEVTFAQYQAWKSKRLRTIENSLPITAGRTIVHRMDEIPTNDQKVFTSIPDRLSRDPASLLDLDPREVRAVMKEAPPGNMDELTIRLAVCAPGLRTSNMPHRFLALTKGESRPEYIVADIIPILQETHGLLIFREQLAHILTDVAYYPATQTKCIIRVLTAKNLSDLARLRDSFVRRVQTRINTRQAEELFVWMEAEAAFTRTRRTVEEVARILYCTTWLELHASLIG